MDIKNRLLLISDKGYNYYLLKVDREEIEDINKQPKNDRIAYVNTTYNISYSDIIIMGNGLNLEGFVHIKDFIETFKNRDYIESSGKTIKEEIHFRNYEIEREEHLKRMVYINMCPDIQMSWFSALRRIGYRVSHPRSVAYARSNHVQPKEACILIYKEKIDELQ